MTKARARQSVCLLGEGEADETVALPLVMGVTKSREDLQNMLRSWTASHAARRIAWDGRWKEMPPGLWKVLNLFLKLTLASLCCSTEAINNRFWLLSQSWKSRVWLAQCPFVLPNLMQMECIKLVKKPKQNNTATNSQEKKKKQTAKSSVLLNRRRTFLNGKMETYF